MKKFLLGLMVVGSTMSLVACGYAEGVDSQFGDKAMDIFAEIDDDTMTNEVSDTDDVQNFDLLGIEADHKREVDFVKGVDGMLKLQDKVVSGDHAALKEYLTARKAALKAIGVEDDGYTVPEFSFYEED